MSNSEVSALELFEQEAHGCIIKVWRLNIPQTRTFPWRYSVLLRDKEYEYSGLSNHMKNKADAINIATDRALMLSKACMPAAC
jgi:hypothetical protein